MIPGNARLLICPNCGQRKEVLSLLSGNTFRSIYWSDGKVVSPMLPCVSGIQKCPSCGTFYFIDRQELVYSDSYSFELGILSFDDCVNAVIQFEHTEITDREKQYLYYLTIIAYNDKYYRLEDGSERNPILQVEHQDFDFFCDIVMKYIEISPDMDILYKAELLREIKCFAECKTILERISFDDDFKNEIRTKMLDYSRNAISNAFVING